MLYFFVHTVQLHNRADWTITFFHHPCFRWTKHRAEASVPPLPLHCPDHALQKLATWKKEALHGWLLRQSQGSLIWEVLCYDENSKTLLTQFIIERWFWSCTTGTSSGWLLRQSQGSLNWGVYYAMMRIHKLTLLFIHGTITHYWGNRKQMVTHGNEH